MKNIALMVSLVVAISAFAEDGFLEKPAGIKVGQRLTLRPYVAFSYSYDSNVDSAREGNGGNNYWSVNPGIGIDYAGGNWSISGSAYYTYHAYTKGESGALNNDSYGEQLSYRWSNIENGGPGWSVLLSERYTRIDQNDDFSHSDGRGLWRDRQQFDVTTAIQRRFTEHWHSSVNAGYYWMDYANDQQAFAPLYGWNRWNVGLQFGYTFSKWTDLFLSGSYQSYDQDCGDEIGKTSDGWTAHIGIGSYMTERISYRFSGGISTFNYGSASDTYGFTYQGTGKWRIGETWMTSLLLSSYYQPSERQYGTAVRCDCISWGIAKSLVRGKVNVTFDVAYRRDTSEYTSDRTDGEWDLNLLTGRLGVNYTINRLLTVFARGEYQNELNDGHQLSYRKYDYERWRATVGLKFTY